MIFNGRKVFGRSSNDNPFWATAGSSARALAGINPLGLLDGSMDGVPHYAAMGEMANWVKTLDSGTITPTAPTATAPQTLVLATAASGNTGPQMQWSYDGGTTGFTQFIPQTARQMWFRIKVKLSEITTSAFWAGISSVDTTQFSGASAVDFAAGIGFLKTAAAANWAALLRTASTSTSQTLTGYAAVANTYQTLDFVITNAGTSVLFYVDGVKVYTQTTLTNIPTAALALTVAWDTTTAAAITATIERICIFQEKATS